MASMLERWFVHNANLYVLGGGSYFWEAPKFRRWAQAGQDLAARSTEKYKILLLQSYFIYLFEGSNLLPNFSFIGNMKLANCLWRHVDQPFKWILYISKSVISVKEYHKQWVTNFLSEVSEYMFVVQYFGPFFCTKILYLSDCSFVIRSCDHLWLLKQIQTILIY